MMPPGLVLLYLHAVPGVMSAMNINSEGMLLAMPVNGGPATGCRGLAVHTARESIGGGNIDCLGGIGMRVGTSW